MLDGSDGGCSSGRCNERCQKEKTSEIKKDKAHPLSIETVRFESGTDDLFQITRPWVPWRKAIKDRQARAEAFMRESRIASAATQFKC